MVSAKASEQYEQLPPAPPVYPPELYEPERRLALPPSKCCCIVSLETIPILPYLHASYRLFKSLFP